jgi:hypothetical protein
LHTWRPILSGREQYCGHKIVCVVLCLCVCFCVSLCLSFCVSMFLCFFVCFVGCCFLSCLSFVVCISLFLCVVISVFICLCLCLCLCLSIHCRTCIEPFVSNCYSGRFALWTRKLITFAVRFGLVCVGVGLRCPAVDTNDERSAVLATAGHRDPKPTQTRPHGMQ